MREATGNRVVLIVFPVVPSSCYFIFSVRRCVVLPKGSVIIMPSVYVEVFNQIVEMHNVVVSHEFVTVEHGSFAGFNCYFKMTLASSSLTVSGVGRSAGEAYEDAALHMLWQLLPTNEKAIRAAFAVVLADAPNSQEETNEFLRALIMPSVYVDVFNKFVEMQNVVVSHEYVTVERGSFAGFNCYLKMKLAPFSLTIPGVGRTEREAYEDAALHMLWPLLPTNAKAIRAAFAVVLADAPNFQEETNEFLRARNQSGSPSPDREILLGVTGAAENPIYLSSDEDDFPNTQPDESEIIRDLIPKPDNRFLHLDTALTMHLCPICRERECQLLDFLLEMKDLSGGDFSIALPGLEDQGAFIYHVNALGFEAKCPGGVSNAHKVLQWPVVSVLSALRDYVAMKNRGEESH